ncbi:MAG: aldo/keto reductase [Candidatus Omnitrophota bacterium]|jgi:predicted aldo/keto reductase-like oxidoreductase|nr:MAG: aldo/keto reductase [Candidatus Omnitrophota bacterium]
MVDRRTFLKTLTAMATSAAITAKNGKADAVASDRWGPLLPTRRLGKTGNDVTMLALGGAHVASFSQYAQQFIETAIAGGIRFFDTAASYGNGESEKLYGRYLTPPYREDIFLLSKAHLFTKRDVQNQLDKTLLNLKTDYLDLWQMHQVMDVADADTRIENGVLDAFLEAKASGKVRHIGFSGHQDPAAHQRILERTDIFEVCQMPISCADASYGSFIKSVLPILLQREMGVIAIKSLAAGGFFGGTTWFQSGSRPKICPDLMTVEEAIHFSWSMPISVLVTGPNNPDMLREKIDFAKSFTPMNVEQQEYLIDKAAHLTPRAGVEFYKSTNLPVSLPLPAVNEWKWM